MTSKKVFSSALFEYDEEKNILSTTYKALTGHNYIEGSGFSEEIWDILSPRQLACICIESEVTAIRLFFQSFNITETYCDHHLPEDVIQPSGIRLQNMVVRVYK